MKKKLFLLLLAFIILTVGCARETAKETANAFDESYLGNYVFKEKDDTLVLTLSKSDDEIEYYMGYYPDSSNHASEELWGKWNTQKKSFIPLNDNELAIAEYKFSDITYTDEYINVSIKAKKILDNNLKEFKIPDGTYSLKKEIAFQK